MRATVEQHVRPAVAVPQRHEVEVSDAGGDRAGAKAAARHRGVPPVSDHDPASSPSSWETAGCLDG